jgi:hypothetical protein
VDTSTLDSCPVVSHVPVLGHPCHAALPPAPWPTARSHDFTLVRQRETCIIHIGNGIAWAETHGHDKIRQLKSNSKSKVFFVSPNLTLALLYQQSRRVLRCLGGNEVCCASQCHNYATIHNRIVPYKPSWHLAPKRRHLRYEPHPNLELYLHR